MVLEKKYHDLPTWMSYFWAKCPIGSIRSYIWIYIYPMDPKTVWEGTWPPKSYPKYFLRRHLDPQRYGNIYHPYTPNVSIYIYIPDMDPMGAGESSSMVRIDGIETLLRPWCESFSRRRPTRRGKLHHRHVVPLWCNFPIFASCSPRQKIKKKPPGITWLKFPRTTWR